MCPFIFLSGGMCTPFPLISMICVNDSVWLRNGSLSLEKFLSKSVMAMREKRPLLKILDEEDVEFVALRFFGALGHHHFAVGSVGHRIERLEAEFLRYDRRHAGDQPASVESAQEFGVCAGGKPVDTGVDPLVAVEEGAAGCKSFPGLDIQIFTVYYPEFHSLSGPGYAGPQTI